MGVARDGDLRALGELFGRYEGPIWGFFHKVTGRRELADDLRQEVFLRVLRYRRSYRSGEPFRGWLYRIARNILADHLRREATPPGGAIGLDGEAMDTLPAASSELEQAELRHRVWEGLGRLAPLDREVLVLSRFQELTYAEIAELLGTSEGAIKVRVHRALKKLAEHLEPLRTELRDDT